MRSRNNMGMRSDSDQALLAALSAYERLPACDAASPGPRGFRFRITAAMTAAQREVAGKFSQIPVSPRGQSSRISSAGNSSAVEIERMEAGRDLPMASI